MATLPAAAREVRPAASHSSLSTVADQPSERRVSASSYSAPPEWFRVATMDGSQVVIARSATSSRDTLAQSKFEEVDLAA